MNLKGAIIFALPFLILVVSFKLLIIGIDKPFWGHHDWNSVVYSNIARNYLRYGYLSTSLGQVTNYDFQEKVDFHYISHYPPLLPILLSFSFGTLGISESAARLVIIFFSLILIFFVYQIGVELDSIILGVIASLALSLTPIFLYFGKLPVHETVVPAISMFGFWAYIKYHKKKKQFYYLLLVLTVIFGGLINWTAFYITPALCYLILVNRSSKTDKKIYFLIPVCVLVFLIQVFHVHLLPTKSTGDVFSNVLVRIDPYLTSDLYGFSFIKYIKQELLWGKVYYSLPLVSGAVIFFFYFLYKLKKNRLEFADLLISSLFIYGIIQLIIFVQLSFIHDYMIYYLGPFMALSFSYIVLRLINKFKKTLLFPLVLIAILSFVFLENLNFAKALLKSNEHKNAYEVAKIINSVTIHGQRSFIGSNSYKEFQEVFVGFYADRQVDYGEVLPDNFESSYKLIVRPKDHDPLNLETKKFLDEKYKKYEDNNFIWYLI